MAGPKHSESQFQRGELIQQPDGTYAIPTELVHPVLPGRQSWLSTGALDSRGNWLENVVQLNSGVQTEGRTVNGVNEYLVADLNTGASPPDPVALTHDANPGAPGQAGNLTYDPTAPNVGVLTPAGQRYVYDVENRLTAVWRTNGTETTSDDTLLLEIRYDALNRRVETIEYVSTDSGAPQGTPLTPPAVTRHIHAGLTAIEEYGISGSGGGGGGGYTATLLREFLWGDRFPEPVAMIDRNGAEPQVFHYLLDDLGNVVGLTDAGDPGDPNATPPIPPTPPKLVERYTYDPYGATYIEIPNGSGGWTFTDPVTTQRFARSTLGNPFMWTGQRYDPTTKLYHFWARSYSPRLGRWLQRDPLGYVDGASVYEALWTNPIRYTDALGLWTKGNHHAIIDALGFSEEVSSILKDASDEADGPEGQREENAHRHAMARPGETPEEAKTRMERWIEETMADARTAWFAGDEREAWRLIGHVLHAIADAHCPSHHGFQTTMGPAVWNGAMNFWWSWWRYWAWLGMHGLQGDIFPYLSAQVLYDTVLDMKVYFVIYFAHPVLKQGGRPEVPPPRSKKSNSSPEPPKRFTIFKC